LDLRADLADDGVDVDVDRSQAEADADPDPEAEPAADARAQTTVVLLLLALAPPPIGLGPRSARSAQRDHAAERLELDVRAAAADVARAPVEVRDDVGHMDAIAHRPCLDALARLSPRELTLRRERRGVAGAADNLDDAARRGHRHVAAAAVHHQDGEGAARP